MSGWGQEAVKHATVVWVSDMGAIIGIKEAIRRAPGHPENSPAFPLKFSDLHVCQREEQGGRFIYVWVGPTKHDVFGSRGV